MSLSTVHPLFCWWKYEGAKLASGFVSVLLKRLYWGASQMSCGNTAGTLVIFYYYDQNTWFRFFSSFQRILKLLFLKNTSKACLTNMFDVHKCFTSSLSSVYVSHCQEQCSQEQGKCFILRCLKSYCVAKQSLVPKKAFRAFILPLLWEMLESSWRKEQGLHQVTAFFPNPFMQAPKECNHAASKWWQKWCHLCSKKQTPS